MSRLSTVYRAAVLAIGALVMSGVVRAQDQARFRTGIELINVTATVTSSSGRFIEGLKQADFAVYEDDQPVDVTHFSAERVPVSLGIILDASGSMAGEKMAAARAALDRFLFELLGGDDEVFLYRFDSRPYLVQGWTTDRARISAELKEVRPDGATSLYDAVAEALPLLQSGRHRKKALLVISDGNDTNSRSDLQALKQSIRQSEAIVYAIGIEAVPAPPAKAKGKELQLQRRPFPPFPGPERRPPPRTPAIPGVPPRTPRTPLTAQPDEPEDPGARPGKEPVNLGALREITDESGGRTELVGNTRDLDPTTARIADELSRQYYLGYASKGYRDGRWHAIRVEVRDPSLRVRARRGYLAP